MQNFVVKVLGSEYNVRADQDGEYVLKVAEIVDKKMREVSNQFQQPNTAKTAVLACMNLVDESLQNTQAERDWICQRVGGLIEKLARVL